MLRHFGQITPDIAPDTKMADVSTDHDNKVRKLRKKLRQIESLQRLCGVRELSSEETTKVMQRDPIRQQLQELLSLALEVGSEKITEKEESFNQQEEDACNDGEQEAQDECKMDADDDFPQKSLGDEEDISCEKQQDAETQEKSPAKEVTETLMEHSNETDDKKVQKKREVKKSNGASSGTKEWKNMKFSVKVIEGHEHPVCAVDSIGNTIISGGHDTCLKIWNAGSCEEVFSLGGHTGSISSVHLVSEKKAITGSQDCSVRVWDVENGSLVSSVYVYSPVTCLAYDNNTIAIGNEGGKIEIYGVENENMKCSMKAHEESVVCLQFMDQSRLASASADGIIKVFEISEGKLVQILDSYDDITGVTALSNDNHPADTPNTSLMNLPLRKINCMATFKDTIFWGDDGFNIKALDINNGQILKLRNNLSEFSPTDALAVLSNGDSGWLFSAGFDIDNGHGYINVRKLPSMEYVGTISDDTLGHVNCISPSLHDGKIRILTGGSELRIWEQQIATNSKKRRASDEIEDVIPCKFNCCYNNVQESGNETEGSSSEAEQEDQDSVTSEKAKTSWCVLQ